ncbi:MAG: polyprenyl synthetase family protein [Ruminococcaceae bacterium]|nr:polyprenyl synthetase family protein [Oscillospiraceae bacterium]
MKTKIQQKAMMVDEFLIGELKDASYQENLREIMEYAVTNGGKRLRPVLLLSAYELFYEDVTKALPYGAALEMIHSYSLVHDDLPSMDNDDLRRGKPTCHKQFSEFGAILAGDALLNLSFETMLRYACNFSPETALRAMAYIAKASGAKGMCAGQMSDMEQSVTDFEKLTEMYRGKTGALLKAAVVTGAILGEADEKIIALLEQYADLVGLIFQIKDDMLDVESDEATLGKPVFSDQKNQKITFVSEYGLNRCRELMAEYEETALSLLSQVEAILKKEGACEFLKDLTSYMAKRIN